MKDMLLTHSELQTQKHIEPSVKFPGIKEHTHICKDCIFQSYIQHFCFQYCAFWWILFFFPILKWRWRLKDFRFVFLGSFSSETAVVKGVSPPWKVKPMCSENRVVPGQGFIYMEIWKVSEEVVPQEGVSLRVVFHQGFHCTVLLLSSSSFLCLTLHFPSWDSHRFAVLNHSPKLCPALFVHKSPWT